MCCENSPGHGKHVEDGKDRNRVAHFGVRLKEQHQIQTKEALVVYSEDEACDPGHDTGGFRTVLDELCSLCIEYIIFSTRTMD